MNERYSSPAPSRFGVRILGAIAHHHASQKQSVTSKAAVAIKRAAISCILEMMSVSISWNCMYRQYFG